MTQVQFVSLLVTQKEFSSYVMVYYFSQKKLGDRPDGMIGDGGGLGWGQKWRGRQSLGRWEVCGCGGVAAQEDRGVDAWCGLLWLGGWLPRRICGRSSSPWCPSLQSVHSLPAAAPDCSALLTQTHN